MCIDGKPFFHIIILIIYIFAFFFNLLQLWITLPPFTYVGTATHGALFFRKRGGTEINLCLCPTLTHKQMNLIQKWKKETWVPSLLETTR